MLEDSLLPFSFPAVERKKVTAAFDGGRITSDGGVMLLAEVEKSIGIADRLAALIADPRNPLLVTHSVADILRARMLAIACGYEDADDLDYLRTDPGFKLACGRLPDSGTDLCSQPTVSRWENAPALREVIHMTYAMIDTYCASYKQPPPAVTLDIDDTLNVVHGHQQLSLFITMNVASCRSTSMTPPHRAPWPCCCGLARRRQVPKFAAICGAWCAGSAANGPIRG
jgi:Transposase DDE domain group 1